MDKVELPKLAYNWISMLGVLMALIVALIMTFLYVIGIFAKETNPYLGILLYMALPPFLIVGLLLIPIGMYRRWKVIRKTGDEHYPAWPYIDLNERSHRNATVIFILGSFIFLTVSSVGSYQAYHYSESVTFCGKTCHTVMKPEHTAYQNSPHARVACVSCHVGPGADWFAKSKLSGSYQVYATLANIYPRPISTPIKNLRPARETCEQCHWPDKFFGAQQRLFDHFKYDDSNTHWPINMLVKTGGGDPETGQISGIHWNMFIGTRIEYIARDERRLDIPWVRATNLRTGKVTIYQNSATPLAQEEIAKATPRILDCVDCHNRPSHIYKSPDHFIDLAILTRQIDQNLPLVKEVSVRAVAREYTTEQEAFKAIADSINAFYADSYPELYRDKRQTIDQAVTAVQLAYSQNMFPEMKVRWDQYPNNIGHFTDIGCMRCHDGSHSSDDGRVVTRDCGSCHTIFSQGSGARATFSTTDEGLVFDHPEDIGDARQETGCYECHNGLQP